MFQYFFNIISSTMYQRQIAFINFLFDFMNISSYNTTNIVSTFKWNIVDLQYYSFRRTA